MLAGKQRGFHRIIEWFGLEGTFISHLAQPHCSEQGHLRLDQPATVCAVSNKRLTQWKRLLGEIVTSPLPQVFKD